MTNNRKFAELLAEHIFSSPDSLEYNEDIHDIQKIDIDCVDYDIVDSALEDLTNEIHAALNKADAAIKKGLKDA